MSVDERDVNFMDPEERRPLSANVGDKPCNDDTE